MAADAVRHVMLVALEVTDQASYARYRSEMTPILRSHGGDFGCDFVVAEVLRGADNPRLNRVFTIEFPDRAAKERFFADPRYGAVRATFFEPAVAATFVLAELDRREGGR
jgi:uncharacterized protein (DUF1330 family)